MGRMLFGSTVLIAVFALTGVGPAAADQSCKRQALDDLQACKAQCKNDFQDAKFACRNIQPACGNSCLAGRQVCFDGIDAILSTGQLPGGGTLANCSTGTDGCKATLDAAKQACGAPCMPGDQVCDGCVDDAQIAAFICRDTCRESWRADPTVVALTLSCRATFKACVTACPPLQ